MKSLYKTTIVIWSEFHPDDTEISQLAQEAVNGSAYCSKRNIVRVNDPSKDRDWDGTEFFGE